MEFRKRFMSVLLVLALLLFTAYRGLLIEREPERLQSDTVSELFEHEKETIHLWYTDEALTDYLNSKALAFMEENDSVRVVATCVPAVEYLETIHDASVKEDVYPDVYLLTSDSLEKAYMAGLATEISDSGQKVNADVFPQTAINAVTYQGEKVAYPFSYETSIFLYNRSYLDSMAQLKAQAMEGQAQADALMEKEEQELQEPVKIVSGADDIIPQTFDDILALADEYDAPEGVEFILKWDVSDIFYNYFFAGNYMTIGGETGDDPTVVDIYNDQSVACMEMYQSLNQFFSIEAKETDYDKVLEEFIEGKTLFTIATTDAIGRLETAKEEGTFSWEYGVETMPEINAELATRPLSVTNTVVVNGYSRKKESANDFAAYLACEADASLYERCGKLPALQNISYENPQIVKAMDSYKESVNLPKIMQASNFWVQLEMAYTGIWQGDNATEKMQQLEEQMLGQIQ